MSKRVVSAVVMVAFCGVVGMGATPSEPMIRCIKGTGNMFVAVELPYEGLWMARLSFGEYRPHAWLDSVLEQTNYQSGNDVAVVVPANRLDVVVKLVSEAGGEVTLFKGVAPWGSPAEELRGTVWHEMPGPFGVVLGSKTHGDSFWMPEVFRRWTLITSREANSHSPGLSEKMGNPIL